MRSKKNEDIIIEIEDDSEEMTQEQMLQGVRSVEDSWKFRLLSIFVIFLGAGIAMGSLFLLLLMVVVYIGSMRSFSWAKRLMRTFWSGLKIGAVMANGGLVGIFSPSLGFFFVLLYVSQLVIKNSEESGHKNGFVDVVYGQMKGFSNNDPYYYS